MTQLDINAIEYLLCKLEAQGELFPEFTFSHKDDKLCLLGKGGFSFVYAMENRRNPEEHYALKITGFQKNMQSSESFYNTVEAQRALLEKTQNIVQILGIRELFLRLDGAGNILEVHNTVPSVYKPDLLHLQFVLMEQLSDLVIRDKFGNLTLTDSALNSEAGVINFALQIGTALYYAHNSRILHRDIKLENIFRDENSGIYKLGDFGAAKVTQDGSAETKIYTNGYGAPEIERVLVDSYGPEADIYSFGITLYLLLNELCFPGSDSYRAKPVQYDPHFVFPAPKNASVPMTRLLRKMCSYDPSNRCHSMAEVLSELQCIAEGTASRSDEDLFPIPDLETEYYQEASPAVHLENGAEESRADRILRERDARRKYQNVAALITPIAFLLLMPILYKAIHFRESWSFWVLAVLLFLEAALCAIKEMNKLAGWIIAGFVIWSAVQTGCSCVQILSLFCLLIGNPLHLTLLGAVLSVSLLFPADSIPIVQWLLGKQLFGLPAVLLFACGTYLAKQKLELFQNDWEFNLFSLLPLVIAAAGLIAHLLVLLKFIPAVTFMYPLGAVSTSIACFACLIVQMIFWGITDTDSKEASENDLPVDQG